MGPAMMARALHETPRTMLHRRAEPRPEGLVLHVTQATTGGTMAYLRSLLPGLRRAGYRVAVACPRQGPLLGAMEALEIEVFPVPMVRAIAPGHDVRASLALRRLIRRLRPSVVHLHSSKAGAVGRLAALGSPVRVVYSPHGWSFAMEVGAAARSAYAFIERTGARLCDRIVNVSADEQRLADQHGIPSERGVVIENGIEVERFREAGRRRDEARAALGIDDRSLVVGMVARLCPQKDPLTFVAAARIIAERRPDARFVLLGDGPLEGDVSAAVQRAGLQSRFRMPGWVEAPERWVAGFDIGVLTSAWEAFGLAAAEYMAAGVPVVTAAVGGLREVVEDGVTGLQVHGRGPAEFAGAVLRLAGDPALRERLADAAAEAAARRFDVQRVIDAHVELYRELMRSGT